jgi:tetratricopeptide (TPR) repeat protein
MSDSTKGVIGKLCAIALLSAGIFAPASWGLPKPIGTPAQQTAADTAMQAGTDALRGGNIQQAVANFKVVTQRRPEFAEGYFDLGLALEQQLDYPAAVDALEKARRLKPGLRGANLFLGIAEYQLGALDKAVLALQREVKLNPQDAKARMWLGICLVDSKRYTEGAAELDAAAVLAPKDTDILYHRGRAHMLVSKESYEQMFALDPDSFRVHEVLGQADAEAGHTSDAIEQYKLAIQGSPHHAGLHEELGDLYWTAEQTDAADAAYRNELAIDPYSVTTCYKLGSLQEILGKPQEALPWLQKAVALDPSFENAYYYLGRAQIEVGQDAVGIANLQSVSVSKADPTLKTLAFYQLARAYRRLHRTDEADAALAQFRALRAQIQNGEADRLANRVERHDQLPQQEKIPADPGGAAQ